MDFRSCVAVAALALTGGEIGGSELGAGRSGGGEQDSPDLVVLADGTKVECRVLFEDATKVVYRAKRKDVEVERGKVTEIQSIERSLRAFLERFEKCDRSDPGALGDLALFAESNFLPGEAHDTWIRVLTLDSENERAWTKLGGTRGRKGWQLKVRGRFYGLQELRERAADWKHALELPTAHFLIRTDAKPERALDLAIDLERVYFAYYDMLGPHLGLYNAWEETPEIHVFTDPKDVSSPPEPGRRAWFVRGENILYAQAQDPPNPGEALAECVDLLVYNSFRRTLGSDAGAIAPWTREGLRWAFAGGVQLDPGRVTFDMKTPIREAFLQQERDPKPAEIERVLNAGKGSFDSGSDAQRLAAQAYTLMHFLAFGEGEKYRAGLAKFMLSSYGGQGAATHLKKILGVDLETLEEQWTTYVKGVVGA